MDRRPDALPDLVGEATIVDLGFEVDDGWWPTNPTIAADGDGFRVVVRTLNWEIRDNHYAVSHADGIIRTRNFLVRTDRDLRPLERREMTPTDPPGPPMFPAPIVGVEDLRLIEVGGTWCAIGSARDRTEVDVARTMLLTLDDERVVDMKMLEPLRLNRHEKNWSPFLVDGELHIVHTFAPTVVLRCDVTTGETVMVSARPGPEGSVDDLLRGGSQGIDVGDGWLFLAHEMFRGERAYLHRFVHLDRSFAIDAMSDTFVFESLCREFCAGMARRDGELVITYGVDDSSSRAMTVSYARVRDLLRPVASAPRPIAGNRLPIASSSDDGVDDDEARSASFDPGALTALFDLVAEPQLRRTPVDMMSRPVADPVQDHRLLTIAMATYDDFDGVWFTIESLRLHHPEAMDRVSILVLDNNPTGVAAPALQAMAARMPEVRYVPCGEVRGTAVRDLCFAHSNSDWVMVVDSHVLFPAGTIARLLEWIEANPDSDDLLQGPLQWDSLARGVSTHFEEGWGGGMYGKWAADERGVDIDAEPFEIPMQGLGCFVARRESWLGFNPRFRGFGGEEGYIHEKYRQAGRRTLCLPFLRWLHRFDRPRGTQYVNRWEDRIVNYLYGWNELGLDETPIIDHFTEVAGPEALTKACDRYRREQRSPFSAFDSIVAIALDDDRWAHVERQATALGFVERVDRLDAVRTEDNHHIGCALSHRRAIELAALRRLDSVLVLEDDVRFLRGTNQRLAPVVDELADVGWDLLYLGGHRWGSRQGATPPFRYLERPTEISTTHAIAYRSSVFERILDDLPATIEGMEEWVKVHRAIDQYLQAIAGTLDVFVTVPSVATQSSILGQESPELRGRYLP